VTVCDPWTTETELTECGCPDELRDSAHVAAVIDAASDWLNRQTGGRFGVCTITERPCKPCGCGIPGWCGCGGESILELSYGPVVGVPTVTVDGAAFTGFYVLPPNRLVRTDDAAWPSCQSLTAGEGTVVTYDYGVPVPALGRLAASDLAIELLKSCHGQACSLPAGTTAVNRRGVSISLDKKDAGKTLPRVAMLLDAYPLPASITRIDQARGLITSGPA